MRVAEGATLLALSALMMSAGVAALLRGRRRITIGRSLSTSTTGLVLAFVLLAAVIGIYGLVALFGEPLGIGAATPA